MRESVIPSCRAKFLFGMDDVSKASAASRIVALGFPAIPLVSTASLRMDQSRRMGQLSPSRRKELFRLRRP